MGNGAPEFPFPRPVPPLSGRRIRDQGMRMADLRMRPVLRLVKRWRRTETGEATRVMIPWVTRISHRVHGHLGFLWLAMRTGSKGAWPRVPRRPKVGSSPGSIHARRLTASYFRTAG